MRHCGVLLVVVLTVMAAATAPSVAAPHYIVRGTVSADGRIALRDGLGNPYVTGGHGMYIITVTDRSPHDDFHLTGPGVNRIITGARFVGVRTIGITLGLGTYHYRSDARPHSRGGTFVLNR
jgi:hypothetical protein